MCCSWLALRDAVVVLGVSWALFGAFAMFLFFWSFGNTRIMLFASVIMYDSVILAVRCNFGSRALCASLALVAECYQWSCKVSRVF